MKPENVIEAVKHKIDVIRAIEQNCLLSQKWWLSKWKKYLF